MKLAILVKQGPHTHQSSTSAYRFAQAALAQGHQLVRVFFYNDGVYNANRLCQPPSDENDTVGLWSDLAGNHGIDLVVCVAAAMRRGIGEEVLARGFRIAGLGQLVEATIEADRTVVFG